MISDRASYDAATTNLYAPGQIGSGIGAVKIGKPTLQIFGSRPLLIFEPPKDVIARRPPAINRLATSAKHD